MKEVIRINLEQQKQVEKPVEFTHHLGARDGWVYTEYTPKVFNKVVYLGKCDIDGDMFAVYSENGDIEIFKGHLNSGKY